MEPRYLRKIVASVHIELDTNHECSFPEQHMQVILILAMANLSGWRLPDWYKQVARDVKELFHSLGIHSTTVQLEYASYSRCSSFLSWFPIILCPLYSPGADPTLLILPITLSVLPPLS